MDDVDIALLKQLKGNSRIPYRELGAGLGLSMTAVHKRIRALTRNGVIQGFRTVLNPIYFNALQVVIFGHAGTPSLENAVDIIGKSKFTSHIALAGGKDLYITGYLEDLDDLDDYSFFVRREAQMPDATIGIVHPFDVPRIEDVNLSYTDYRIVQALHDDSRKALADVAEDLGLSPKTVRRRLDAMVANGAVLQTLALLPETSNDLIAIFRISLKRGVGPMQAYPRLVNRYGPRLLSIKPFTNLSNIVLCTIWCRTMTEVKELHRSIEQEPSVESAVLNIVYDTRVFETWIDRVLIDMATSPDPKLSVGKGGRRGQGKGKGESREQRRKRRLSIRTIAELEAYRKALVQALADGVITSDEDAILRSLRDTLKISEAEHTAIFKMICSDLQKSPKEIEAYRQALAQALEDGVITDDEEAILMTLRDSLKISDEDHKRLLDVMSVKRKGKRGSG